MRYRLGPKKDLLDRPPHASADDRISIQTRAGRSTLTDKPNLKSLFRPCEPTNQPSHLHLLQLLLPPISVAASQTCFVPLFFFFPFSTSHSNHSIPHITTSLPFRLCRRPSSSCAPRINLPSWVERSSLPLRHCHHPSTLGCCLHLIAPTCSLASKAYGYDYLQLRMRTAHRHTTLERNQFTSTRAPSDESVISPRFLSRIKIQYFLESGLFVLSRALFSPTPLFFLFFFSRCEQKLAEIANHPSLSLENLHTKRTTSQENTKMDAPLSSPTHKQAQPATNWPQTHTKGFGAIPPTAPQNTKAPSTDTFLKDFTLVAEAAKRAQMAVMIRDLENVGLS